MTGLLAQATSSDTSGGALAAYVALAVSILTPLVAVINAWSGRKTRRERDAAAKQAEAQGGVITTGTPLEWRTTDHQALLDEREYAKNTRAQLSEAEAKVRMLRDQVAEQDRKLDACVEDLRQLRVAIAACPGGPICPLVAIPPKDNRPS